MLKRASINGVELAYFDEGGGLPLVMLHGWPEHSHSWRKLAALLRDRYRCIALDFRGMGDSQIAERGFDKKTLASDVRGLLDHLGIASAIIVAHDWGAPVGYRLALDASDRVAGLIIMNGRMPLLTSAVDLMYTPQQVRERWYFFFNLVPKLPEIVIQRSMREYFSALFDHWKGDRPSHSSSDIDELIRVNSRPDGLRAGLGFYRTAVAEDVADWTSLKGRTIAVPNLVLWGAKDPVLPPIYLEGLETVTPDLDVKINETAGHFIQQEAPAWCADHMREFLSRRFAQ
jgi:haloacetate dehalogenase